MDSILLFSETYGTHGDEDFTGGLGTPFLRKLLKLSPSYFLPENLSGAAATLPQEVYDAPAEDVRKNAARARGDVAFVPFVGGVPAANTGGHAPCLFAHNPDPIFVPCRAYPVEENVVKGRGEMVGLCALVCPLGRAGTFESTCE
jgi:hypothetical protein